jgi:hypothetical protein
MTPKVGVFLDLSPLFAMLELAQALPVGQPGLSLGLRSTANQQGKHFDMEQLRRQQIRARC